MITLTARVGSLWAAVLHAAQYTVDEVPVPSTVLSCHSSPSKVTGSSCRSLESRLLPRSSASPSPNPPESKPGTPRSEADALAFALERRRAQDYVAVAPSDRDDIEIIRALYAQTSLHDPPAGA